MARRAKLWALISLGACGNGEPSATIGAGGTEAVVSGVGHGGGGDDARHLLGDWAMQIDVPVSWSRTPAVRRGDGHLGNTFRLRVEPAADDAVALTFRLCGMDLPETQSMIHRGERYLLRPDDAPFDAEAMAEVTVTARRDGDGASWRSAWAGFQAGVVLAHPADDVWPRNITALDQDHGGARRLADGGQPGLRAVADTSNGRRAPPAGLSKAPRLRELYFAIRNVMRFEMVAAPGQQIAGRVVVRRTDEPGADHGAPPVMLDSLTVGCVKEDGRPCDRLLLDAINRFQPQLSATAGTLTMTRIAAGASCAAVRAAANAAGEAPPAAQRP